MSSADETRVRAPLSPGSTVGVYQIVKVLGAGAMGEVYRARDTRLGRDVALKLLPATNADERNATDLAEREARIVASLNHPNILALHDVGAHNGLVYLVTELVEGESLRGLTPPLRKALDIAAQIADGLSAAHAAGVTHRDLKPDNVMVTHDGRVKLLDFGVAKTTRVPSDLDATIAPEVTGVVIGTLGYMAPEQVRASEVDGRADIFSFGAVLYELLTGARAFAGETAADVITSILTTNSPDLPGSVPPRCATSSTDASRSGVRSASSPRAIWRLRYARPPRRRRRIPVALLPARHPRRPRFARNWPRCYRAGNWGRGASLQPVAVHRRGNPAWARHAVERGTHRPGGVRAPPGFLRSATIDPIVRVQMGRLRSKLRGYYERQGAGDPIRIEIPIGAYVPFFASHRRESQPRAEPGATPPAVADDLRLAVLPIVNMSADPENQYFCDGLTEELISRLAQIPQLRVVAQDIELSIQGRGA